MAAYSGWGGAARAFEEGLPDGSAWAEVQADLRRLLGDDGYASARASVLTAFYTPPAVADAMVAALAAAGVGDGAEVLEPGCGTGAMMAAVERAGLGWHVTGVECDHATARMAALLHPWATVVEAPLEDCEITEGSFDAVVGNVPYSEALTVRTQDGTVPIHDYFVLESARALRPGGAAALLTSTGTLDKRSEGTRTRLAQACSLDGAWRLPVGALRDAGTDVSCDLLVLTRRAETLTRDEAESVAWVRTDGMPGTAGARAPMVNAAFLPGTPPDGRVGHALGTLSVRAGRYGDEAAVTTDLAPDATAQELMRQLVWAADSHDLPAVPPRPASTPRVFCARRPQGGQSYEYVLDDAGNVWYGGDGSLEPVATRVASDMERLRDMVALRDLLRETLSLEAGTADDVAVGAAVAGLERAWRSFTEEHGLLHDRRNRRAWSTARDMSLSGLLACELVDEHGALRAEGDVLLRRVQGPTPPLPDHLEDPAAALAASLDRTGGVDMGLVASLLGTDAEGARRSLGDLVVEDPDTGEVVEADAYLSGDVRGKLAHVRGLIAEQEDGGLRAATDAWALDECHMRESLEPHGDSGLGISYGELVAAVPPSLLAYLGDPDATAEALAVPAWNWFVDCHLGWHARRALPVALAGVLGRGRAPLGMSGDDPGAMLGGLLMAASTAMRDSPEVGIAVAWCAARRDGAVVSDAALGLVAAWALAPRYSRYGEGNARALDAALGGSVAMDARAADQDYRGGRHPKAGAPLSPEFAALGAALRARPESLEYLYVLARAGNLGSASEDGLEDFSRRRARRVSELARDLRPGPRDPDALGHLASLLEQAQPPEVRPEELSIPLGAAWVPSAVVMDFVREFLDVPGRDVSTAAARNLRVAHDAETGEWRVTMSDGCVSDETRRKWGTSDVSVGRILQAALNHSVLTVTREDEAGNREPDREATALANRRKRDLSKAWDAWVREDPARLSRLARTYNARVNRTVARRYDGSMLTLPGSSPTVRLRPHQLDAVARATRAPEGTLLAHVVGAGKTFEGVAAAMESKRLGRCRKPMFAVPNNITEQWAESFCTLYPSARVICMTHEDTRSADAARAFWARVATGDWDAVIVGHSRFSQLRVSPARRADYLERRVEEMKASIEEGRELYGKDSLSVKQLEKVRRRAEARLDSLRDEPPIEGVTFEDLGVDWLFVDEAHGFKNLAVDTYLQVAGISNAASKKCEDLLDKCEYLREQGHGANVVFATGTPVSNSMCELYNLERYLAPGLLEAQGCHSFAAWASTFGEVVESMEVRPEGNGYQMRQRFARFQNLPELMASFHQFADIVTKEDVDLDVPRVEKVNVTVEPSQEQRDLIAYLGDRADDIRAGGVDPHEDNMLKITSEGRKLAIDPKLLPGHEDDEPMPDGKVQECAERVLAEWRRTADERGTQLVFCDTSTPAGGGFNALDDLRRRLVALGIPEGEVAVVNDARNEAQRQALFDRVSEGRVRVLMGSTQTLGTGVNVQERLCAIHNLDCPWRPSDLEQRLGRVERQGNLWDEVRDYRYVTKGTFDSYLYQTVERKQRFVSQVFTSRSPLRTAPELDEAVLDVAQVKALATGDPTVRLRMEAENRVSELELGRRAWAQDVSRTREEVRLRLAPMAESTGKALAAYQDDSVAMAVFLERWSAWGKAGPVATVDGREVRGAQEVGEALLAARPRMEGRSGTARIGRLGPLAITLSWEPVMPGEDPAAGVRLGLMGEHNWESDRRRPKSWEAAVGQLRRIAESFGPGRERCESAAAKASEALEAAEAYVAAPWEHEGELAEARSSLAALTPGSGTGRVATADEVVVEGTGEAVAAPPRGGRGRPPTIRGRMA